jgi:peroxiredoxin
VLLDHDRNGWQDIVIVNANSPEVQFYRNRIGELDPRTAQRQMIAVRFVGGNHRPEPSEWSNRDGYGAVVKVELDEFTITREHRAGEGFAGQNSGTMFVGIGERDRVRGVRVRWPSGREQELGAVPARTIVTVYENPVHSPTGEPYVLEAYTPAAVAIPPEMRPSAATALRKVVRPAVVADRQPATLNLYTTMTSWCAACIREAPHVRFLRSTFPAQHFAMYGVPVDANDTREKLEAFLAEKQPGYELLIDMPREDAEAIRLLAKDKLHLDGTPATIITDAQGRVLQVSWGMPTVSDVRKLLASQGVKLY